MTHDDLQARYDSLLAASEKMAEALEHAASGGTFFPSDHEKQVHCREALASFNEFKEKHK